MTSPVIELPSEGFDVWLAGKSANFRQQMRRARRKLEAAGGRVSIAKGGTAIERAAQAFSALHEARWQSRGGSGLDPGGTARMLADAAAALGPEHLRLWTVELDGRPIAVEVFAATGGEVAYANGGWDERHAALKPALLGILAAVEDAMARGERRIDFGAGDHPYKLRITGGSGEDAVSWGGLFPVDRRYPVTRLELAPRQLGWWARRRVRALPPSQRARLDRLRALAHGKLR